MPSAFQSAISKPAANRDRLQLSRFLSCGSTSLALVAEPERSLLRVMDKTPEDEKGEPPPLTVKRDLGFLPIPHRARHDPDHPPRFSLALNLLFGIASTITVANLYYVQPLLAKLASSFDVSYSEISLVPTLLQAGYATGLLLISPLGDLVRRRPLVLLLLILTTGLSIGLALASSIKAFEALSFLIGVFTVTPQILLPLSADLAPPDRKASAISITLSGLLLGLLFARVFAGVIAEFASYRIVYWTATGLQAGLLLCIYIVLPDYPSKNVHGDLTYFKILWTMAKYAVTGEPCLLFSLTGLDILANQSLSLSSLVSSAVLAALVSVAFGSVILPLRNCVR